MNASWSRIRLGLYGVVLLALVTAAIIALVSIGGSDPSTATAGAPPTTTTHSRPPTTSDPTSAPPGVTTTPVAPSTSAAPTTAPTSSGSPKPSASGTARSEARNAGMRSHTVTRPPKIYTVRKGDNLWDIARWFDLQGYQPLYAWNKTVVGKDPSLIFPGQKIVVVPGGKVTVGDH